MRICFPKCVAGLLPPFTVTLSILEHRPATMPGGLLAAFTLPAAPASARAARGRVRAFLMTSGIGKLADDAEVIVSELVANAVRHAASPADVVLITAGRNARDHHRGLFARPPDESGQGLRPPKGRTWGRRGRTPVVTVTGGSNKRVSLAALIAVKSGQRPRLVYRVHQRPARREAQGVHRD